MLDAIGGVEICKNSCVCIWILSAGSVRQGVAAHILDLLARHADPVTTDQANYLGADDHDDSKSDNRAGVEPCAEHPGAMLVDLEAFDVDVSHNGGADSDDREQANQALRRHGAPKRISSNHQRPSNAATQQEKSNVAADSVEEQSLMANRGDEMKDDEEAGWYDCVEMQRDAYFVVRPAVVMELAWCTTSLKDTVQREIFHSGETEAEHGTGEDNEEDEVVALLEADRVVHMSHCADEAIGIGVVYVKAHCGRPWSEGKQRGCFCAYSASSDGRLDMIRSERGRREDLLEQNLYALISPASVTAIQPRHDVALSHVRPSCTGPHTDQSMCRVTTDSRKFVQYSDLLTVEMIGYVLGAVRVTEL